MLGDDGFLGPAVGQRTHDDDDDDDDIYIYIYFWGFVCVAHIEGSFKALFLRT